MNINNKKYEFLNNLTVVSMLVYLFFLSRRGGNTKDIISIFIMFLIFIYSFKNGIKGYLMHKKDIIISVIYLILVSISYIIVDEKGNDKFYVFSHATIFSIGFMLVLLNYKLNNKYVKCILPILLLISISPIYKGSIDVYEHLDSLLHNNCFDTSIFYSIKRKFFSNSSNNNFAFYYTRLEKRFTCCNYSLCTYVFFI